MSEPINSSRRSAPRRSSDPVIARKGKARTPGTKSKPLLKLLPLEPRLLKLPPPPRPVNTTIGRETELAALTQLIADPEVRLLTLTGEGGIGKTRLLLQWLQGNQPPERPTGWISFVSLQEPERFLDTIAEALAVSVAADQDVHSRLVYAIGGRSILLAFDNLEHLSSAATHVGSLLENCPNLRIITSSRKRLSLTGEWLLHVGPLGLPRAGQPLVSNAPAVILFTQRARALAPTFPAEESIASIARIVEKLDGNPLAIELAAGRVLTLPLPELEARLDHPLTILDDGNTDVHARQRTLRSTIAWSAALLTDSERASLRRLAVFPWSFDLDAAEFVVHGDSSRPYAINASADVGSILALVEHHFLRLENPTGDRPRYRMLVAIREFAKEWLQVSEEESAAKWAHAIWYLNLFPRESGPGVGSKSFDQARWYGRAEVEMINLRQAFRTFEEEDDGAQMLQLATNMQLVAWRRGQLGEVRQWHAKALASADKTPSQQRCAAMIYESLMSSALNDFSQVHAQLAEALEMAKALGDDLLLAVVWRNWAIVAGYQGQHRKALTMLAQAERHAGSNLVARVGNQMEISSAWLQVGGLESAKTAALRAREVNRELGDIYYDAIIALLLGTVLFDEADYETAKQEYRAGLDLAVEIGDRGVLAESIMLTSALPALRHDYPRCVQLVAAADGIRDASGRRIFRHQARFERLRDRTMLRLDPESYTREWNTGIALPQEDVVALAIDVLGDSEPAVPASHSLSARQLEVLLLMAEGMTDRQIAEALFIARPTASNHVRSILQQFEVHSRAAAVAEAYRRQLVPPR